MRVTVTSPGRFEVDPDGRLWTDNPSLAYNFWARYLDVFDEVLVCARAHLAPITAAHIQVTGPGVSAAVVPYFVGPLQFSLRCSSIVWSMYRHVKHANALIVRVPCVLGTIAVDCLSGGRPFGAEVVADPYDVFAAGSVRSSLRIFFRWWSPRKLKKICMKAPFISYVTECALQRRYPPSSHAFSTSFSSIDLPSTAFAASPRSFRIDGSVNLITIATLAQLYKAPDVLIDALSICVSEGLDLRLSIIGDGQYRAELEARCAAKGIRERVYFTGQLTRWQQICDHLDKADVFILPSYQEGLPRAMIEAMARGLPCIGSTVGGIPELLPLDDMVPPGSSSLLAEKICQVVLNPTRMTAMSARNLKVAHSYEAQRLRLRRIEFYSRIKIATAEWTS